MKIESKNRSIALIIAIILTIIFVSFMYVSYLNKIKELDELESSQATGSLDSQDIIKEYNQNFIFGTILGSVFIFCVTTLISYMILERLIKRKK